MAGDAGGDLVPIAGEHEAADAHLLQGLHGGQRLGANTVGERDGAERLRAIEQKDDGFAFGGDAVELRVAEGNPVFLERAGAEHAQPAAADGRFGAPTGEAAEIAGAGQIEFAFLGAAQNTGGDGMLRGRFDGGRYAQDFGIIKVAEREHIGDAKAAFGERAGLVEDHMPQLVRAFKGVAIANEQAAAGGERGADGDDQRDRQPQSMRAGNHHDRDCAGHGEAETSAEDKPRGKGDSAGAEGHGGQPGRRAVGQVLGARTRCLGLPHHLHHLGEVGMLAGLADFDGQGTFPVERPADRGGAGLLFDRPGFAGQHGFVHAALAGDNDAVDGHALAGLHQHTITGLKRGDGDIFKGAGLNAVGGGGQQPHQRVEGSGGAHHRSHLDPVAEQHDVNQGGQLPLKAHAGQSQPDRGGIDEGRGDGHRDERHHARLAALHLIPEAGEKRPPAIAVDQRGKTEQQPMRLGEQGLGRAAEQHPEAGREGQNRHCENQAHQEPAAKVADHGGMVSLRVRGLARGRQVLRGGW